MKIRIWWKPLLSLFLSLSLVAATTPAQSQTETGTATRRSQHVVSLDALNKALAELAQIRQANEAEVRGLVQSEAGQKAMKSLNVGYEKVDKAVAMLSDADLSRIADRSRQAEKDFAAGGLGSTLIIAIVLIIVLAIVLSAVFR